MDPVTLSMVASKVLPMITGGGKGGGGGTGSQGAQAGMSLASGILQHVQANKFKKQAEAAMPDQVDPTQTSFLAELNQKRKSIETGADFQEAMNEADSSQASVNDAIIGAGGGNVSSIMQGLLQAQKGAGSMKNKALAQGQQQQMAYDSAASNMLNKIAGRKLELQMFNQQQAQAQYAQTKQTARQNTMAGMSGLLSMGKGGGTQMPGTPSVATPPFVANAAPAASVGAPAADMGIMENSGELGTLLGGI